jgi:hypothetical protein
MSLYVAGPRFIREEERPAGKFFIRGQYQSAFTACHVFTLLQAKAGKVAHSAGEFSLVFGPISLRAILNRDHIVFTSEFAQRVHLAHVPRQVHCDDSAHPPADLTRDIRRVERQRERMDVGKHRHSILPENRQNASDIGNRRNNHFVSRLKIERYTNGRPQFHSNRQLQTAGSALSQIPVRGALPSIRPSGSDSRSEALAKQVPLPLHQESVRQPA